MSWCLVHLALKGSIRKISIRHQEVYIKAKFLVLPLGGLHESCSATWNLVINSAFALGPKKTTETLDRVSRSQEFPDANWLLASSLALNTRALTAPGSRIYIAQEQGGPVIPPGTGFTIATVDLVMLRVGVAMEILMHSNGDLQSSTVAGRT
jgi:hypothetical protein